MATISGELISIGGELWQHPVDAPVLVLLNGSAIGHTSVDPSNHFEVEIPDDARGELEIRVALNGAAPAIGFADGEDVHATVVYNPGGPHF